MRKKYKLRYGVGVSAETVVAEFERIDVECGGITPKTVLDESRPDEAPLHPVFNWNDPDAAELWRLHQATNLVRCVHVFDEESGEDRGSAFVRVTVTDDENNPQSVYKSVGVVVTNESLFCSALNGLLAKVAGAKRAVSDLHRAAHESGNVKNERLLAKAMRSFEQAENHLSAVSA